jgi:colanic acid biosynthesis glycosyl transferase WcaI
MGLRTRNQLIHLCPNWLNGSLAECVAKLPSKVGRVPGTNLRLLYAGNIGKKQGLLEFCSALARIDADFEFDIHGNGGEAQAVREWVNEQKDPRFRFGEFLNEDGFTGALHHADVFVITEKAGSGASFIPSKLIPGIATGTPVLAVCDRTGPLGREMEEEGLGCVLEWGEMERLGECVRNVANNPTQFKEWQENCIIRSKTYQREYAICQIAQHLETLVQMHQ